RLRGLPDGGDDALRDRGAAGHVALDAAAWLFRRREEGGDRARDADPWSVPWRCAVGRGVRRPRARAAGRDAALPGPTVVRLRHEPPGRPPPGAPSAGAPRCD